MKTLIGSLLGIVFSMLIVQCSFVDIDTPGLINHKKMFQNKQGFIDAMAGIYASMASSELYGKELSYSFIDEIAQLYENDYEQNETFLTRTYALDYTHTLVRNRINAIWNKAYASIASINNVLEQGQNTQVVGIEPMMAEAYGMRAMLHFDLLRLFAPNISEPNAVAIPYVKTFSSVPQPFVLVQEAYNLVLQDLLKADEIYSKLEHDKGIDEAVKMRNSSFLYVSHNAVKALLARVYLWGNNKKEAALWAKKVLAQNYELAREEQLLDLFRGYNAKSECILALHAPKMYIDVRNTCYPSRPSESFNKVRDTYRQVFHTQSFTVINNDYRFQTYFSFTNWGKPVVVLSKLFDKDYDETQTPQQNRFPAINLIRLPEMYYILAEASYETNRQESVEAFNKVIVSRGLKALSMDEIANDETFKDLLVNEITKEFWGEGQVFFTYKRLSLPLKGLHGRIYPASHSTFVLPLPEAESLIPNS